MTADDTPLAGLSVLVVEDSWHIAEALRRTLVKAGADVIGPTGTLPEAEQLAATGGFDIAVMDLDLGDDTDASELALRLVDKGVKVVLLTAFAMPGTLAGRVHGYLSKPARPQALIDVLRRVAGR